MRFGPRRHDGHDERKGIWFYVVFVVPLWFSSISCHRVGSRVRVVNATCVDQLPSQFGGIRNTGFLQPPRIFPIFGGRTRLAPTTVVATPARLAPQVDCDELSAQRKIRHLVTANRIPHGRDSIPNCRDVCATPYAGVPDGKSPSEIAADVPNRQQDDQRQHDQTPLHNPSPACRGHGRIGLLICVDLLSLRYLRAVVL